MVVEKVVLLIVARTVAKRHFGYKHSVELKVGFCTLVVVTGAGQALARECCGFLVCGYARQERFAVDGDGWVRFFLPFGGVGEL